MADDSDRRRDLLRRIEARRADVGAFLGDHRPRTYRRTNTTIVLSSLAAALTAGPAVGGEAFAEGVASGLGLPSDSVVWQALCALALVTSLGAAVLTNIGRAHDDVGRLSKAEAARVQLEGLASALELGQVSVAEGVEQYRQCLATIAFVDERPGPVHAGYGTPPRR